MNESDFVKKPVLPLLTVMSLPMVFSMLVNALYNIIDSLFVARIGESALTALSLVYPIQNLVNAIAIGYAVGINALTSIALGAQDKKRADTVVTHGMIFSAIHGVLAATISIAVMPGFLRMFTDDPVVLHQGLQYSRIVFLFAPVIMWELVFEKIYQAAGRMYLSMSGLLCGCIVNIILDPLLIFGIGIFPELGIAGAALATGIGQLSSLLVYFVTYLFCPLPMKISRHALISDRELDKRLYSVGIPAVLNLALPSLLISAMNAILSAYSQTYVLILGIYYKLQTFLYLPANGIIQGMRPIIGHNYGAGEKARVRKIFITALGMTGAIMLVGTILCLTTSEGLMGLFTEIPEIRLAGARALRIISTGFLISAVSITASGALEGLGKGLPSLVISLFRYLLIILPSARLLCRTAGPDAVWHAFWITEIITALAAALVCSRSFRRL